MPEGYTICSTRQLWRQLETIATTLVHTPNGTNTDQSSRQRDCS